VPSSTSGFGFIDNLIYFFRPASSEGKKEEFILIIAGDDPRASASSSCIAMRLNIRVQARSAEAARDD